MNLRAFFKYTAPGRLVLIPARLFLIAGPFALRQLAQMARWAFVSKEYYNHTYHLSELNCSYLASYVSVVSGHPLPLVEQYVTELENDTDLRHALEQRTLASRDRHNCDVEPRYGRRLGWYALVRATRPRVVVETGVDRGLGTAVIAAALKRNAAEGFPGLVFATDIMPDCGHLLAEPYKSFCRILIGDSVASLKQFQEPVDIFLHDSNHDPAYEWAEFLAIEPRLHPASLILSDNSQQTPKLMEFAQHLGKAFLYFQDQPRDHWWPGDGIGAAFVPGRRTYFPDGREPVVRKPSAP
ncbi:MAG TPA: class I SAM-dependent methyltransferase [Verrucomicrobiae bacterium]|nr:class I SAM-dependent methyltransferase [Verrucomicrobiae bacterium]